MQSGSVSSTITSAWDDASQLTSISDANSAYAYTYDDIGRTLTVSNSGTSGVPTVVLTSAFDAASNRTKLTSTIGGTADFENDYSYDNLLRLTRVDQIGQSGGNTVADKRVDFVYDVGSRLTSLARNYKSGGSWTEAATTAFSYDTIDRLTGIDHKRGGTSLLTAYSYSFDYANRITGITSQDGTVTYTNDATNQLTGADYSYQTDETFSFDANGNWNMSGYTNGTNNKRSSDGTYNYTYDKEGNLILRVKISDSSRTEYTWDYRNRLTNITERATLGGAATKSIDYVYDVFDRRISKSFDADGAGAGAAVVTHFVYDGSSDAQVILQFGGSNNLTHRDLWAENIDQILADENSSNAILWSLNDNLGTVRDLIDNTGTVQNHLKYGAFHNVTSETNAAIDFLMGAAGMVRDEETGASYAWHRYTINGRWLSEDPIEFEAGDPNLGRVVGNSPTDLIDPSGLVIPHPMTYAPKWLQWIAGASFNKPSPKPTGGRPSGTFSGILDDLASDDVQGMRETVLEHKEYRDQGVEVAQAGQRVMLDTAGLGTLVDAGEAASGRNVIDGTTLTGSERLTRSGMAAASALPFVPDELLDAAKNVRIVLKSGRPDPDVIKSIKLLPSDAKLSPQQIEELSKNIDAILTKTLPAKAVSQSGSTGNVQDVVNLFKTDPRFRFIDQVPGGIEAINSALGAHGASLK